MALVVIDANDYSEICSAQLSDSWPNGEELHTGTEIGVGGCFHGLSLSIDVL